MKHDKLTKKKTEKKKNFFFFLFFCFFVVWGSILKDIEEHKLRKREREF